MVICNYVKTLEETSKSVYSLSKFGCVHNYTADDNDKIT